MVQLVVMILLGLFSIFCSIMNYDWFIGNRKAWIFVKMFGRNGARIFYIIVGIFVIVVSVIAYMKGQM